MAWTIPDQGEGASTTQSILFQEYLDVLVAGLSGIDGVLSGCAVSPSSGMSLAVAKGAVLSNRGLFAVAAGNVTIGTADATHPRIDLVVVNSSGTKAVRAGTAGANPKPPARTANDVVLASVYVAAGDTTIGATEIDDKRTSPPRPTTINKIAGSNAFSSTTSPVDLLALTLPNGLLAAGNMIEFMAGGTILLNSGAPTLTLAVNVDAGTLFSDASSAATADADRLAWMLCGTLASGADNDQRINGVFCFSPLGAKTAPTLGRAGDLGAAGTTIPFAADVGTTDLNSANAAFSVTLAMSVSSASNEIDIEYSFVRLL